MLYLFMVGAFDQPAKRLPVLIVAVIWNRENSCSFCVPIGHDMCDTKKISGGCTHDDM